MVHGIGEHQPGYSSRLADNLMTKLNLDQRVITTKRITLREPDVSDDPLGGLRISRYLNGDRTHELLFYELTWSNITEPHRKAIEYDSSGEYAYRRTPVFNMMKRYFNENIVDPLLYLGEQHEPILTAVEQSICWMIVKDWHEYEDDEDRVCDVFDEAKPIHADDEFAFVTHSLGSRIIIDALQRVAAERLADRTEEGFVGLRRKCQDKRFRIYMLANQLPLLEVGRTPAEVRREIRDYCMPGGRHYQDRLTGGLSIYAFSDPNDLLSYPIPPEFAENFIDSRLCPEVTNVVLNVANPISILGLAEVANPLEAHANYDRDERVISIIAHGFGNGEKTSIDDEKCTWRKLTADS